MADSLITFSLDAQHLQDLGIILNPARANFVDMFLGEAFSQFVGTWFNDMFASSGFGKWSISAEWMWWKSQHGLDRRPNIMTGRLRTAMSFPVFASHPAGVALRAASPHEMVWGVDADHPDFQTDSGDAYPVYVADKNPFAYFDASQEDELAEMTANFLLQEQARW